MRADPRPKLPPLGRQSVWPLCIPVGVWVPGDRRLRGLDRNQIPASLASSASYPRATMSLAVWTIKRYRAGTALAACRTPSNGRCRRCYGSRCLSGS